MVKSGDQNSIPAQHLETIKDLGKDITFGKVIGVGKFAYVCEGTMGSGDQKTEIAIKVIDLNKNSKKYRTKFLPKELNSLNKLKVNF